MVGVELSTPDPSGELPNVGSNVSISAGIGGRVGGDDTGGRVVGEGVGSTVGLHTSTTVQLIMSSNDPSQHSSTVSKMVDPSGNATS